MSNAVFNCYLAEHYRGGSLTHPMLITCVLHIRPEGQLEPPNEVGFLSQAERLVGSEPRTFRFWSQFLNPLGHSPIEVRTLLPSNLINISSELFFILLHSLQYSQSLGMAGHTQLTAVLEYYLSLVTIFIQKMIKECCNLTGQVHI